MGRAWPACRPFFAGCMRQHQGTVCHPAFSFMLLCGTAVAKGLEELMKPSSIQCSASRWAARGLPRSPLRRDEGLQASSVQTVALNAGGLEAFISSRRPAFECESRRPHGAHRGSEH